jgi:carboxypeptidase PM20D1
MFRQGRGTIDDKQGVLAILEAMEWHLELGFKPQSTIYVAFGHDEEMSGNHGAYFISQWFQDRQIQLEYLLDEGMTILMDSPLPLKEVAIIGLAEKGSLDVDLVVDHVGGHSSLSTKETAVDILSQAIRRIYENPMPVRFDAPSPFYKAMQFMGPEMSNFLAKAVLTNLWLFNRLVSFVASSNHLALVNIRTTSAATMISGGIKSNVLPTQTRATINHRIIPGDTVASVLQHDIDVINDPRVKVIPHFDNALEPSFVSSEKTLGFISIASSIRETFVDLPVIPSLFIANTDTRHYWGVAKDIYRFCPTIMAPADLGRFHGINERISIQNYFQIIRFYFQLIKNH